MSSAKAGEPAPSRRVISAGRREVCGGGQDPVQPQQQLIELGRSGQGVARHLKELAGVQVVEMPLHPIGEHPDVTRAGLRHPIPHVARELGDSVLTHVADPQVPLNLEHRRANLDVDPTALAHRRLQHDLLEVLLEQVQPGRQQQ